MQVQLLMLIDDINEMINEPNKRHIFLTLSHNILQDVCTDNNFIQSALC